MTDIDKAFNDMIQESKQVLQNNPAMSILKYKKANNLALSDDDINPNMIAQSLMTDFKLITLEDNDEIYCYDSEEGIWKPNGELIVRKQMASLLGMKNNTSRYRETLHAIRSQSLVPRELLNNDPDLMVVGNGTLNIRTLELKENSPENFCTIKIPIDYEPEADCPEFKKFLSEVTENSKDILGIQELFGYCLRRDYKFHKAWMLYGTGGNGKSKVLNALIKLMGEDNISSVPLQELEVNRFAKIRLYNKFANIFGDLSNSSLSQSGIFKQLCGEDTISGEMKHKGTVDFKNHAKLIFACNQVPEVRDDSNAFYRRWIIIKFPKSFTDDPTDGNPNMDNDLESKILADSEMKGILNWALEGMKRLYEQKYFTNAEDIDKVREKYILLSDPLMAFFDKYIDPTGNDSNWIEKGELKSVLEYYFLKKRVAGFRTTTDYTKQMKSKITYTKQGRPSDETGARVPAWMGIMFNKDGQDFKDEAERYYSTKIRGIINRAKEKREKQGKL